MYLSNRVNHLAESQTIAMARKSRDLAAQGINIISLTLGEPDFNTPDVIKQAAKKAIDDNFSFYTHVSGYVELRQAICGKFLRDNNLEFTPDEIVVSTGAKQSIANVVLCMLNPGDEVIIPAPYWVTYTEILKLSEAKPVIVNTSIDNEFKITPEQLKKAITPKTRMMIFSSPCNPTGSVYSEKELAALADVIKQHKDLYVVSDEIYEHINFVGKHASIAHIDGMKDRTIIINGVSKGFAMTGWRGGILAAPKWVAQACDKMQGQFTSATCSITQKAMYAAMQLSVETTYPMRDAFKRRRDLVVKQLSAIKGFKCNNPDGAFYVFPEVSYFFGKQHNGKTINNATDFCMYLLEEAAVSMVPGAAFGDDNYLRISYATSEEKLTEAINRIKQAVEKLK
ncbi:MAG TPA: pyridoxal phosphate-dependent aminotransferase [Bacteroidia bacterium]|jgi:aspartate aminotransferase|nr:pyridoxal phosphate-dependent aminotransferase [Bacteroidia bacterium]